MNSNMDSKLTGMWVSFFTAAGIPSDVSATYALTFTENRIQNDMLLDLNKEYLKDMGIIRMGDVIAILRHAKQVHENTARDKVLNTATTASAKVPVAAVTGRTTVSQPSSPASRILEHYTRNPQVSAVEPPTASHATKRKSTDLTSNQDLLNKKLRQIRFDVVNAEPKEGPNKTVFARLGTNGSVTIATKCVAKQPVKPIYARLGDKPDGTNIPVHKDALKYEGILKSPPAPKNVTVSTSRVSRKIITMRADEAPLSVRDKLALPKTKSVKFSNDVQYKVIDVAKAPASHIFNKPERRLTVPEGVRSRLGAKGVNDLTITNNVFHRLGGV